MRWIWLLLFPFTLFGHSVNIFTGEYQETAEELGISRSYTSSKGWSFSKDPEDGHLVHYIFEKKNQLAQVQINGETVVAYAYKNKKIVHRISQTEGELFIDYYKKQDKVKSLRDGNGELIATFTYNPNNTIVLDACGEKKIYWFTGKKNLVCLEVFDENGSLIKCERYFWKDHFDQPLLSKKSVEDGEGNLLEHNTYKYDRHGLLREETDFDTKTFYEYDEKQVLKKVVENAPSTTFITEASKKTEINHAFRDVSKAWECDLEGRLKRFIENEKRITSYSYDEKGNLTCVTKPDGVSLNYEYDGENRLKRIFSSDGTVDDTYTYDENNRLISVGDTLRSYDANGLLRSETLGNGLTLHYSYDEEGKCKTLTLPDGSTIDYEYDSDCIKTIHRKDYSYSYCAFDENTFVTKASLIYNSGEITYTRSEKGIAIKTPFWSQTVSETDGATHILEGNQESFYSYDDQHQLTEEPGNTYTYDSAGNRLSKNGSEYLYDDFYQLVQVGNEALEYDLNGNLIKNGPQNYFYDALNRLIRVEIEGEAAVSYTYDAFNRRLSKDVNGEKTLFFYEDQREIGSTDASETILELRVLGIGHGAEAGAAVAVELQEEVYIPIHDYRGNLRLLVDPKTGKPFAEYSYSAFGESSHNVSWGFSSKRHDPETGLIYFGRRIYDPKIGRWLTRDPLLGLDGKNPYAYVRNNPLEKIDLYGLTSFPVFWKKVGSFFANVYASLVQFRDQYAFENYFQYEFNTSLEFIVGDKFFYLTGYHIDPPEVGVYGNGECEENVRITFINGVLNDRPLFTQTIENFSNAHGGNNIHFVFRNTEGWTKDVVKGFLTKMGVASPHAKKLANQWRYLIADMGGTKSGGLIIHYAHSLGGADTAFALQLLKPEERKMIRVITIGSPCTIPITGLESAINYGSCHDGISLLNIMNHIHHFLPHKYHVVFVGSFLGIPFFDHFLDMSTYTDLVRQLGKEFLDTFGKGSL